MRKPYAFLGVGLLALAVGCARSDAGISAKVKSKLIGESTVQAREINVETKNKVVTLTGTVATQVAKDKAVEIARSTEGATDVVDNLIVKQGDGASSMTAGETVAQGVDDAAITAKVKGKLLADPVVGGLKIDVDTRDGVVTLSSSNMKSQTEIEQAVRLAKSVEGVKDVRSNLTTRST